MNIIKFFGFYVLFSSDLVADQLQSSGPVSIESAPSDCSHSSQHGSHWPIPFPIKETMFRRAVWDNLTKKVPLNQVERGYVLDGLYEECVRYCM